MLPYVNGHRQCRGVYAAMSGNQCGRDLTGCWSSKLTSRLDGLSSLAFLATSWVIRFRFLHLARRFWNHTLEWHLCLFKKSNKGYRGLDPCNGCPDPHLFYLNSCFVELDVVRDIFSLNDVWILRLRKQILEFFQLTIWKSGATSSLQERIKILLIY